MSRLYRHEVPVLAIAVVFVVLAVGALSGRARASSDILMLSQPAISVETAEFAADAARITYASINGEQVPSNDSYPVVRGDVIVLTIQAVDPMRVATCGIVISGTMADVEHAAYPGPATCEVILP